MARAFKVNKPSGSTVYRITVPAEIARLIEGVELVPELTEEGLCYRPVGQTDRELKAPTWAPAQPSQ